MRLRREPQSPLEPDLSNLGTVTAEILKQALESSDGTKIRAELEQRVLSAGQSGQGVPLDRIPPPMRQRGADCQTWATINGIIAIGERRRLTDITPDIRSLVAELRARVQRAGLAGITDKINFETLEEVTIDLRAPYDQDLLNLELTNYGIPLTQDVIYDNPIETAQELFRPGHFMTVTKKANWHATTIVPLAGATSTQFVARLNSMDGSTRVLSVRDFIRLMLEKNTALYGDNFKLLNIRDDHRLDREIADLIAYMAANMRETASIGDIDKRLEPFDPGTVIMPARTLTGKAIVVRSGKRGKKYLSWEPGP